MIRAVRKLRGRSIAELQERVAQALAAAWERAGRGDTGTWTDERLARTLKTDQSLAQLVRRIREGSGWPAFGGIADPDRSARSIRDQLPHDAAETLRAADEIVDGTFRLLGFPPQSLGVDPPWHRDPVLGVDAPRAHWSRIAYLDPRVVGDHKLVWELSRHAWLVTLGLAWRLTGDAKYPKRAAYLLGSWMDSNPPKQGIHWASSLEVAYRAIAWMWAMRLLGNAPELSDVLLKRWLSFVYVSARHVERHLSTYFSPNTHLTGEALGLLYVGTHCPEFVRSDVWRDAGWRVLRERIPFHVRADGTYYEQAMYYHRYTLDIYLHAKLLADASQLKGADQLCPMLIQLAEVLRWTARPDGTMPLFGDEDGGKLLFLDARPPDDVRSSLDAVAALCDAPHLTEGVATQDLIWLTGTASLPSSAPSSVLRRAFGEGGWYVMRSSWEPNASVMTIDCGPLGADNGGHAHADTLAFDLAVRGKPLFVDAGTVSYTTNPDERDAMRSTAVHNTLAVGTVSSSTSSGPFRWSQMTAGTPELFGECGWGAIFVGHHDGYNSLALRHRRIVAARPGSWWALCDCTERTEGRSDSLPPVMSTFQCAPGLHAKIEGAVVTVSQGDVVLATLSAHGEGEWMLDTGLASRRYGSRTTGARLRFRHRRAVSRVTFVISEAGRTHAEGEHGAVLIRDEKREDFVFIRSTGALHGPGDLHCDGEVMCGNADEVLIAGATWVEHAGRRTVVAGPVSSWQRTAGGAWIQTTTLEKQERV